MSFPLHVLATVTGLAVFAALLWALHAVGDAWARWKARREAAAHPWHARGGSQ